MNIDKAKKLSNPFNVALITLGLIILISYLVYWDVLPDKKVIYKRAIRFIIYMGISLCVLYYYQMLAIEEIYYDKMNISKGRELISGAAENDVKDGITPNFINPNLINPNFEVDAEPNHNNNTVEIEPVLGL